MRIVANPAQRVFSPQYVAVGGGGTPFIQVYQWANATPGFGTKYANPAILPTDAVINRFDWTSNNADICVPHELSPHVAAYPWTFYGFGTKYADPSPAVNAQGRGCAFSPSDNAVFIASGGTTSQAYAWTVGSGFGTKYADPSPSRPGTGASFSPAGNAVAQARNTTPRIDAWAWSSGFGTKYANPATPGGTVGWQSSFSPDAANIGLSTSGTPYIQAWKWSVSGFGTKYTNPATLPSAQGTDIQWNPSTTAVGVSWAGAGVGGFIVYPWDNVTGFGSKYSDPATMPAGRCSGISFNKYGTDIVVNDDANSNLLGYPFNTSTGIGTKYANASVLPTINTDRSVVFSN